MRPIHFLSLLIALSAPACKESKTVSGDPDSTSFSPARLVEEYRQGEVQRCTYQGKTIYLCGRNAPDAGQEVFDDQGKQIGGCYYSTNRVDPPCEEAQGCQVIYRVSPNIWGKPGVDWTGESIGEDVE